MKVTELLGFLLFVAVPLIVAFLVGVDYANSKLPSRQELIKAGVAQYDSETGYFTIINKCQVTK